MGLFDDFVKAAKNTMDEIKKSIDESSHFPDGTKITDIDEYDNPPEKLPSITVQDTFMDRPIKFNISQDFEENPVMDAKLCYEYTPNGSSLNSKSIFILFKSDVGEYMELEDCLTSYYETGEVTGRDISYFETFSEGKFLFKFLLRDNSYHEYVYVLRQKEGNQLQDNYQDFDGCPMVVLYYDASIDGSRLERKLIECFDEVVKTLTFM